jgi:ElaB/YqjD/DUF883 family membrane-anchored ribosome-binding protein
MTMHTAAEKLGDQAHNATDRSEAALRQRASELHKFIDDVEELIGKVSDRGEGDVSNLRRKLESSIGRARSAAKAGMEAATDGTRRAARATNDYVHHNPWTSIGIAAGTGLLAGLLLARR